MQEQNIELTLDLPDSDQEVEKQEFQVPKTFQPLVPIESFSELNMKIGKQIIENYMPLCLLYQNERTVILKCQRISEEKEEVGEQNNGSQVVIKFSPLSLKEGKILEMINKRFPSAHIIKCLDLYESAVVLESCRQSLAHLIEHKNYIGNQFLFKLLKACVEMLEIIEQMRIVHFDFKPSNILFRAKKGQIEDFVLADFGNCLDIGTEDSYQKQLKALGESIEVYGQSYQYFAPESAQKDRQISLKSDVWGLGCILFECITGQSLLPMEISNAQEYNKVFKQFVDKQQIYLRLQRYSFPSQVQLFGQLITSMLSVNPNQRPSVRDLKEFLERNEPK